MIIPRIRYGDFFKHEDGFSPMSRILCIDIRHWGDPNNPTHTEDDFFVEVTLDWLDLWLPDKAMWSADHAKHLQMSEYMKFEVFRGTLKECERAIDQLIGYEESDLEKIRRGLLVPGEATEFSAERECDGNPADPADS